MHNLIHSVLVAILTTSTLAVAPTLSMGHNRDGSVTISEPECIGAQGASPTLGQALSTETRDRHDSTEVERIPDAVYVSALLSSVNSTRCLSCLRGYS